MTVAWVLGSTGLLGSALHRELLGRGTALFAPSERLRWGQEPDISLQISSTIRAFAELARISGRWEIYWAAGVGTMGSLPNELVPETKVLLLLLTLIKTNPYLLATPGSFAFASSAGAIYAGSEDDIVNEKSAPAPINAYALAKLEQEGSVQSCLSNSCNITALIARISTIYGPGQSDGKQQGLITHIARSIVRNRPIQIYVPFDTIRDYIETDDVARVIISALRNSASSQLVKTKIVASERPTTIAEIISIFKRLSRRRPLVVTSASSMGKFYSRRVQFESIEAPACTSLVKTSLVEGIAKVIAAEKDSFARASFI